MISDILSPDYIENGIFSVNALPLWYCYLTPSLTLIIGIIGIFMASDHTIQSRSPFTTLLFIKTQLLFKLMKVVLKFVQLTSDVFWYWERYQTRLLLRWIMFLLFLFLLPSLSLSLFSFLSLSPIYQHFWWSLIWFLLILLSLSLQPCAFRMSMITTLQ